MSDQLTREQLETLTFDPHRAGEQEVKAMAMEVMALRARVAELEAGLKPDAYTILSKRLDPVRRRSERYGQAGALISNREVIEEQLADYQLRVQGDRYRRENGLAFVMVEVREVDSRG